MSSLERPERQPTPPPNNDLDSAVGEDTLSVHRSPRYKNFMFLGAALGVVLALVLTTAFPDNPDFSKAQVFGFLLLACLAAGVLLGSMAALILDRTLGRRTHPVLADRLARDDSRDTPRVDESTDTQHFTEKSE